MPDGADRADVPAACPRRDSNPHPRRFKRLASAGWTTGAGAGTLSVPARRRGAAVDGGPSDGTAHCTRPSSAATRARRPARCSRVREFRALLPPPRCRSPATRWPGSPSRCSSSARTGSALAAAATVACSYLTWLFGGPLLSGLADRFPRRRLMVVCDLLRAALVARCSCCRACRCRWCSPCSSLVGLLSPPFDAAKSARAAGRARGRAATSSATRCRAASSRAASSSGFLLGGAVVAAVGARGALAVDAATFVLSAAGCCRRPSRERPARPRASDARCAPTPPRASGWSPATRGCGACSAYGLLGALLMIAPEGLAVPVARAARRRPARRRACSPPPSRPASSLGSALLLRVDPAPAPRRCCPPSWSCPPWPCCSRPLVRRASPSWPRCGRSPARARALGLVANAAYMQAVPRRAARPGVRRRGHRCSWPLQGVVAARSLGALAERARPAQRRRGRRRVAALAGLGPLALATPAPARRGRPADWRPLRPAGSAGAPSPRAAALGAAALARPASPRRCRRRRRPRRPVPTRSRCRGGRCCGSTSSRPAGHAGLPAPRRQRPRRARPAAARARRRPRRAARRTSRCGWPPALDRRRAAPPRAAQDARQPRAGDRRGRARRPVVVVARSRPVRDPGPVLWAALLLGLLVAGAASSPSRWTCCFARPRDARGRAATCWSRWSSRRSPPPSSPASPSSPSRPPGPTRRRSPSSSPWPRCSALSYRAYRRLAVAAARHRGPVRLRQGARAGRRRAARRRSPVLEHVRELLHARELELAVADRSGGLGRNLTVRLDGQPVVREAALRDRLERGPDLRAERHDDPARRRRRARRRAHRAAPGDQRPRVRHARPAAVRDGRDRARHRARPRAAAARPRPRRVAPTR